VASPHLDALAFYLLAFYLRAPSVPLTFAISLCTRTTAV
jgi:hypothetical protein